jgi:hypothetical protein
MIDLSVQIIILVVLMFNLICMYILLGEKRTTAKDILLAVLVLSTVFIAYGLHTQNPAVAVYHK